MDYPSQKNTILLLQLMILRRKIVKVVRWSRCIPVDDLLYCKQNERGNLMSELVAFKNGVYMPLSQCTVSVMDLGITNSASVTDFLRTFNHKPFRMEDHVDRFFRAAKNAYLRIPYTKKQVYEITEELIRRNVELYPECEMGVIFYVTPGINYTYAGSAAKAGPLEPTYIQHVFPMPFSSWKPFYTQGIKMATPSVPHLPPQCVSPKGKHRNRLHMWMGDHQLQSMDQDVMGLYLDQFGNITETGGSNFVIYRDGAVYSPRARNILWGVSLKVLTELLGQMGIPFYEEDLQVFDVVNADEAWVTTTPYCMAPVRSLNGIEIGDGTFAMWRKVLDQWSGLVGKDLYAEVAESQPIRYR